MIRHIPKDEKLMSLSAWSWNSQMKRNSTSAASQQSPTPQKSVTVLLWFKLLARHETFRFANGFSILRWSCTALQKLSTKISYSNNLCKTLALLISWFGACTLFAVCLVRKGEWKSLLVRRNGNRRRCTVRGLPGYPFISAWVQDWSCSQANPEDTSNGLWIHQDRKISSKTTLS